ncbi:MAG: hypothetical protein JXR91_09020 [Deltaproteobacteria bacterium]|nr:hypothetical protein [Deltaproteobacteria bacterium]
MSTINVSVKQCGTCRYWDAVRSIQINAGKPLYVKTDSKKHPCIISQTGKETYANTTCSYYQKWEKL